MGRDDFELLNSFFNGCKAAQEELKQWRRYFVTAREEKARVVQSKLLDIADRSDSKEVYNENRKKIIDGANEEDFLFNFKKPETYFTKYVQTIPRISGTTVMTTLRHIAKEK